MKTVCFLLLALISLSATADELRFHLMRSPLGIDWSSPWKLTMSTLKNQVAPVGNKRAYSISHVFVELKCDSVGKHILRGMTSATSTEERELVFKKKYGLGTMFHTFKGFLEKDDEIVNALAQYKGHKRKAEVAFKISGATCERLLDYAYEYERLGYGNKYAGLQGDPLKREGSGCSAFAVSFLRVGGLMGPFTEEWKEVIDVPLSLIGGPMTGNKVNIITLLTKPFARWSSKVPHYHLEAWNPEAIHAWIGKTFYEVKNGSYRGPWAVETDRDGKTLKVKIDLESLPTPTGDYWLTDV